MFIKIFLIDLLFKPHQSFQVRIMTKYFCLEIVLDSFMKGGEKISHLTVIGSLLNLHLSFSQERSDFS